MSPNRTHSVTPWTPRAPQIFGGLAIALCLSASAAGSSSADASKPAAPTSLWVTEQTTDSVSLAWTAAAPGAAPIASYKIYRNNIEYATVKGTTFRDKKATNANSPLQPGSNQPTVSNPNTVYAYSVAAVDALGNESPPQSDATFWVYHEGIFNWQGDFSYPGGSITINYSDKSGASPSGFADIAVSFSVAHSGFQPYAGNKTTAWDMEAGAFNYLWLDLKPTLAGQEWGLFIFSRIPPGDSMPWSIVNLSNYGPKPQPGVWATYKVPLKDLTVGLTHFVASISGNKLSVSRVISGVGVDAGGFVSGPGVPAGTYIVGFGQAGGGAGAYTVAGPGISASTSAASAAMVEQRTGIYKFGLVDRNDLNNNRYFVDNIRFTVN